MLLWCVQRQARVPHPWLLRTRRLHRLFLPLDVSMPLLKVLLFRILMYVQFKNYFLGKTTHERFSKRASHSQAKLDDAEFTAEGTTPQRKVANEVNPD